MKTQRNQQTIVAAALCAALTLGLAGGAYAQQGGVSGGSATDNTSAGNTNGGGLPQVQQQGDVSYVSGGVGQDESRALQAAQSEWPLTLRFTGPTSNFLADVQVRIVDAHDGEVLNTTSRGPFMLVRLHPGRYTVHAKYNDREQTHTVTVPAHGNVKSAFVWSGQ
ncbi:carboxypeptidase regulatory-like domain-containing protein [Paraburkholderia sp. MMS20-SJTR3]|uniref:Carboxypeptidase regulatory-like domain-containing protein n=1 Tax=Paraburkholderia sejongensis TaxID=2886946 RepID=A0ABS8JWJ4_9BURK|nr:carboxypeptidase regulatory-like domain-containing protein [Paraburkholderia sp. MMS20-SJTR3]MCC8394093.1 carboxypeptidase regulatory-like domain-containing protein [Paraburkholderia sp. MMS20-SJTR3]